MKYLVLVLALLLAGCNDYDYVTKDQSIASLRVCAALGVQLVRIDNVSENHIMATCDKGFAVRIPKKLIEGVANEHTL